MCPVSTEGGTRRVQLVREGGGGGHLIHSPRVHRPFRARRRLLGRRVSRTLHHQIVEPCQGTASFTGRRCRAIASEKRVAPQTHGRVRSFGVPHLRDSTIHED
jgi:hypothetical protein